MKLVQVAKRRATKNTDEAVLFNLTLDQVRVSTELGQVIIQIPEFHPKNAVGRYEASIATTVDEFLALVNKVAASRTEELKSLYSKLDK